MSLIAGWITGIGADFSFWGGLRLYNPTFQLPTLNGVSDQRRIRAKPCPAVFTKNNKGWATDQRSVDSRAYDGERMLAVHAVGLLTIINHHKVSDYGIRTIGTEGHSLSRAIRIDGIGPGVRVPTGVERITVDDYVLQPRRIAIAIVMTHGYSDEWKLGRPEDERAMDGTAVIALNGFVRAGLSHGRRS